MLLDDPHWEEDLPSYDDGIRPLYAGEEMDDEAQDDRSSFVLSGH
jgi:hypothetical protein